MHNDVLKGKFHAHITVRESTARTWIVPKGWKTTIIVLNRENRSQKDLMITRHFMLGSEKTPDMVSIMDEMELATQDMSAQGYDILRAKLEHESLPTLAPAHDTYREAHVKIQVPTGVLLQTVPDYVMSSNPMVSYPEYKVLFLNARYYEGTTEEVDRHVDYSVAMIKQANPQCTVMEVKKETTVFDTNHNLDKWWA